MRGSLSKEATRFDFRACRLQMHVRDGTGDAGGDAHQAHIFRSEIKEAEKEGGPPKILNLHALHAFTKS